MLLSCVFTLEKLLFLHEKPSLCVGIVSFWRNDKVFVDMHDDIQTGILRNINDIANSLLTIFGGDFLLFHKVNASLFLFTRSPVLVDIIFE